MHSTPASVEAVRRHAEILLTSIGVSRIVVVDDEYSEGQPDVEELLGICTSLSTTQAAALPHLDNIDFDADREIWADRVRETWKELDETGRREVLQAARAVEERISAEDGATDSGEGNVIPSVAKSVVAGAETPDPKDVHGKPGPADSLMPVDTKAARSLEEILSGLEKCAFVTLSLTEWKERANDLLTDEMTSATVFLFDRDFGREQQGAEDEGFNLVREVQGKGVGFCGLISHTVQLGSEHEARLQLADEHGLVRDKFVIIAKERLTGDSLDHYSFLRMLRLVALSGRCASVKSAAWSVFDASVAEAKATLEGLSVLDFEQIVLASSRHEGVWEPDTLYRVFGILMRRAARNRLYQDTDVPAAVSEARRISAIPEEVAPALGEEQPSREALRIQRFEIYESDEALSRFCLPLELGDIFERPSTGRRFILLAQPCDLMVRKNGKRSYDKNSGRTGALVELVVGRTNEEAKPSWGEAPFYDEDTGVPAYADFAKVHQVRLAVLDLCSYREDGVAEIEIGTACPELAIEPWKNRHQLLQSLFEAVLKRYDEMESKKIRAELRLLALPAPSTTVRFCPTVNGRTVRYDLKRVMRLRQPWSGALLTAFTHYQARAAFEHPFERRVPMLIVLNDEPEADATGRTDAPK